MPHFGLMDEAALSYDEAALLRARLHLRGGRRRLDQGKFAAGVAALFDALCSGMRWHLLTSGQESLRGLRQEIDLRSDRDLFLALVEAGVFDNPQDFSRLDTLLDQCLAGLTPNLDADQVLALIEGWLTRLGVMPFDESALPPEDPNTY